MLLVISCILGGYMVNQEYLSSKFQNQEKANKIVETINKPLNAIKSYFGIFCIVVGVWSFFSPYYSKMASSSFLGSKDFIGDLFPAMLSFLVGLMLSIDILSYVNLSKDEQKSQERKTRIQTELEKQKTLIGFVSILFGVLHIIDYIGGGYPLI